MRPNPTILAFDTSAAHCAAALLINGQIVASRFKEMERGQAEHLMPMLEEVLAEVGAQWEELDAIGVGIGPGNFTGIRIAVSAARGLSLSLKIPAIGVSNFDLLRKGSDAQMVSLEAPKDQVYIATYEHQTWSKPKLVDPHRAGEDFLVPNNITIRGAQADIVKQFALMAGGTGYTASQQSILAPAEGIAKCAAEQFDQEVSTPRPSPLYIRPADAAPSSDPPPVILP